VAKKTRFSVTFELLTPASVEEGDFHDHGWIDPRTERERSLRLGGKAMRERNIRMAQKGTFDWRLSAAVKFLNDNAGGPVAQAEYSVGDQTLRVDLHQDGSDVVVGRHGYEEDPNRKNYSLFCEGLSERRARVVLAALNAPSWATRQAFPETEVK